MTTPPNRGQSDTPLVSQELFTQQVREHPTGVGDHARDMNIAVASGTSIAPSSTPRGKHDMIATSHGVASKHEPR